MPIRRFYFCSKPECARPSKKDVPYSYSNTGSHCDSGTNRHSHSNAGDHCDSDTHSNSGTHGNANSYAGCDSDADIYSKAHRHAYSNSGADSNANSHAGCDGNADIHSQTHRHSNSGADSYANGDAVFCRLLSPPNRLWDHQQQLKFTGKTGSVKGALSSPIARSKLDLYYSLSPAECLQRAYSTR